MGATSSVSRSAATPDPNNSPHNHITTTNKYIRRFTPSISRVSSFVSRHRQLQLQHQLQTESTTRQSQNEGILPAANSLDLREELNSPSDDVIPFDEVIVDQYFSRVARRQARNVLIVNRDQGTRMVTARSTYVAPQRSSTWRKLQMDPGMDECVDNTPRGECEE